MCNISKGRYSHTHWLPLIDNIVAPRVPFNTTVRETKLREIAIEGELTILIYKDDAVSWWWPENDNKHQKINTHTHTKNIINVERPKRPLSWSTVLLMLCCIAELLTVFSLSFLPAKPTLCLSIWNESNTFHVTASITVILKHTKCTLTPNSYKTIVLTKQNRNNNTTLRHMNESLIDTYTCKKKRHWIRKQVDNNKTQRQFSNCLKIHWEKEAENGNKRRLLSATRTVCIV